MLCRPPQAVWEEADRNDVDFRYVLFVQCFEKLLLLLLCRKGLRLHRG